MNWPNPLLARANRLVLSLLLLVAAFSGPARADDASDSLRIGLQGTVTRLDPLSMYAQEQWITLQFVYGTLTTISPAGIAEPGLASGWKFSADSKALTFTLRPGLTFSDGTPLRSKDVVASLERLKQSPDFTYAGLLKPIDAITATDETTVNLAFSRPYESLPTLLGQPQFGIFPASALGDAASFFKKPISAGQYVISDIAPDGTALSLVRNDKFWGKPPVIRKLDYITIPDADARAAQLRGGELEVADSLGLAQLRQLEGKVPVKLLPAFGNVYFILNNNVAPGSEKAFRQALSLALDRKQINDIAFRGLNQPAFSFFSPISQWYEPTIPDHSLDAAKSLIATTSCKDGCALSILVGSDNQADVTVATIMKQQLAKIGVDLKIVSTDAASIWGRGLDGNFEAILTYVFDYTDEPDVLVALGLRADGGIKAMLSGYASPQMDAAVQEALGATGDARRTAISTVSKIFTTDLPFIPIVSLSFVNGSRVDPSRFEQTPTSLYRVGGEN